mgnify:CR=1 FL=1
MRIARVRARRAASCEMPAALPCRRWFRMEPRSAAPAACGRSRGTSVLGGSHCRSRAGRAVRGAHRFPSRGGGAPVVASLYFLHSASPARACCDCDAPLSRHASGACGSLLSASGERRGVSLACVLRAARDLLSSYSGRSAASLSCLVLVVRVSLLRRSLCLLCAASSLLAPSAQPASERRQYARSATPGGVWRTCAWIRAGHSPYRARALFRCVCRCVRGPTGHWPLASAPAACCGSLKRARLCLGPCVV